MLMSSLSMGKIMNTQENLAEAFAGESQANRRYLAFAEAAEKEGKPGVARLFRAVAAAEAIHALSHFKAMGGIKTTLANLAEARGGEAHEFTEMYPAMVATAEAEGKKPAARSMHNAMEVEKVHYELFGEAAAAVEKGGDVAAVPHICPICGHTVLGDAPDRCPVCGCAADRYLEIA